MKKFLVAVVALLLSFSAFADVYPGKDKEMCRKYHDGSFVKITLETCEVTGPNYTFFKSYYQDADGKAGIGCWAGNKNMIRIWWEDLPGSRIYPTEEFRSCDTPYLPELDAPK